MTDTFDALAGDLDYPMVVVTAAAEGERSGCLVGFHGQCSIDPLQYAVWLSVENHTYRVTKGTGVLAVHFLDRDQHALAELFGAQSGDEVDKLARCRWHPGPDGVPLLDDCPNRLVGRIAVEIDAGGDHAGFVLDVLEADRDRPVRQLGFQAVRDIDAGHAP
jgi:flavin reductase (DIM6/NTAB) family NADH-FMN oxidoreductase RutF